MAPVEVSQFHRDQRYHILPAYTQDGVLLWHVFRGATNAIIQGVCVCVISFTLTSRQKRYAVYDNYVSEYVHLE